MKLPVPQFLDVEEVQKMDEEFPHPEGAIEAGWYFQLHEEVAPIGPFSSEEEALNADRARWGV